MDVVVDELVPGMTAASRSLLNLTSKPYRALCLSEHAKPYRALNLTERTIEAE
jgi:hypothetical protein